MSILQHESKCWPVALTVACGEPTLDQHMASLQSWNHWFARAEPFHVIRVFLDDASIHHSREIGNATREWMKTGADKQIQDLVQSMLIVVPLEQYSRMQKMSVNKIFGIPGGLFPSLNDAFAWLERPPVPVKGTPVHRDSLSLVQETVEEIARSYEIQR